MQLNSKFVSNIQEIYGPAGQAWLDQLPSLLQALGTRWHFEFIQALPELSYSFVGLVKLEDSEKTAIIKIVPEGGNITREMKWLRSIEKGVPQIYQADEEAKVFLMEHLQPGTSLKDLALVDDEAATRIICQTIRDLQASQHAEFQFQPLHELIPDLAILRGRIDPKLLSQAESWFHEMTAPGQAAVVLHGDLHHYNILASGSSWKAIDPHGYLGDPVAEVGVMIRNPMNHFPRHLPLEKIIERRLQIMAEELPFDPQRIRAWAFCMTILSAAWTLEGHAQLAEFEIAVAKAIITA